MEKLNKELIEKLASDLMLELQPQEITHIEEISKTFLNQIAVLQNIDTSGVEAMSYPFEIETSWFREDEPTHVISQELAFENAPRIEGDYFEIVKVVNK